MAPFVFDQEALRVQLARLDHRRKVTWALLTTERMIPNYAEFHRQHRWGRPDVVREAVDRAWAWLRGLKVKADERRRLGRAVDRWTPDTEVFGSPFASAALDVATATNAVLCLLAEDEVALAVQVGASAVDTVYLHVAEEGDAPEHTMEHPLMQRELQQQADDLAQVSKLALTLSEITQLQATRSRLAASSIGWSA